MLFSLFRVSGHSMEPTFKAGQTLIVSSILYLFNDPKVGDVVVVKDPRDQKPLLKRIVKTSGNKFFVAGDNPKHSTDSRIFGVISIKEILGKVVSIRG